MKIYKVLENSTKNKDLKLKFAIIFQYYWLFIKNLKILADSYLLRYQLHKTILKSILFQWNLQ